MPDPQQPNPPLNGATPPEPPKSLRQIAEEAYDQIEADAEAGDPGEQPSVDDPTQPRDALGRFAARPPAAEPGEADGHEADPAPRETPQPEQAHPAPEGSSSEPPVNWNAADRDMFAKQTPEAKAFLLRRHSEMEGDYQRRVTATAQAANFAQSLAPVFSDPVISGSLQQSGMGPTDAIMEWASMHRRAMSPNPADRVGLLVELAQRMQIDPAALAPSRQGNAPALSEQDMQDPAIRYFADHVGQTSNRVQALEGLIQNMVRQDAERQNAETLRVTRWGIDSFAEEKDAQGNLLRPDFDQLLPQIIELFQANPQRDLREAYETARWMNPQTRTSLLQAERTAQQRRESDQRARQAVRVNARGITSPVSKPADPGDKKGLRAIIEESAEEVGF